MKQKESEKIELKKSTSELKEAIISIVSILNKHQSGKIIFGIKNNGDVVGQDITEKTLREISQAISNNIESKIHPKVKETKISGKRCIEVEFSGNQTPYFAYGRAYIRVADEDKALSSKELERMILEKNRHKMSWDSEIYREARLQDIDKEKFRAFLTKADLKYDNLRNTAEKLGLLKNKKPVNAALILFGKEPEKFFENSRLRCAVFAKVDTSVIIDRQDYYGDLFMLIQKAEEYLLRNIHIGMRVEGLSRIDVPEIDREAFREALVNAFCHRDYRENDSVALAIFKDRVEIRNPGNLYGGLTIEDIKGSMVSKRRNPLIASLFHKVKYVEQWGRGIRLILSKEKETEFRVVADVFITIFKRKDVEKNELGVKLGVKLGVNEDKILRILAGKNDMTAKEIAKEIGISLTAAENNIAKLKRKGVLKRVGSDKGGHWEIIRK